MLGQILVLVILILLNAYFAATEIAFISLNDTKIERDAKEGNKKAKQILKMLKSPSKFLATIQIGITFAGFLSNFKPIAIPHAIDNPCPREPVATSMPGQNGTGCP